MEATWQARLKHGLRPAAFRAVQELAWMLKGLRTIPIHTHQHHCRTSETLSLVSMGLSGKSPCLLEYEVRALGSILGSSYFS